MNQIRIQINRTRLDWLLEAVSVSVVITAVILFIIYWNNAPDIVPIHYNLAGQIDAYDNKTSYIHILIVNLSFYIGLSMLSRYPHIFNYPVKVTVHNAEVLYKIGVRTISIIKLLICIVFAFLFAYQLFGLNLNKDELLNYTFILFEVVWMTSITLTIIIAIIKMMKIGKE